MRLSLLTLLSLLTFSVLSTVAIAANTDQQIDKFVYQQMQKYHVPSQRMQQNNPQSSTALYQAGTLLNLTNGLYQGTTSLQSLYAKGDFGLGTTNGPEGEMIILNKQAYAADINGNAHFVPANIATPFAMIVKFQPDRSFIAKNVVSLNDLIQRLDSQFPSKNIFYAIKVSGDFQFLRMRDWEKPHAPIPVDQWINKTQHITAYKTIKGTLVIFKAPEYASPITVGGYHVHFISDDHKKVGHVYDIKLPEAKIEIETLYNFNLLLPNTSNFINADLQSTSPNTIAKLETNN